ncbi:MAG: hypothetical protein R2734_06420 [Nocardioides sp.]
MTSTKSKAEAARRAYGGATELKRREQRRQRVKAAAVVAVVVGMFIANAAVAVRGLGGGQVSTRGDYYAGKTGFRRQCSTTSRSS